MTVSSMTPSAATAALYASQPAFGGTNAGAAAYPVTGGVASATAGAANVAAKPSIGARLLNAMKAALSELRGGSVPQAASPLLPAGQALVASPRSAGAVETLGSTAVGATPGAAAGANSETPPVRHLKASSLTAKQKAAVKARVAAQKAAEERAPVGSIGPVGAVGPTGAAGAAGFNQGGLGSLGALPANATQLPNATVYSYDQNGNPAVAGLQGLPSATQAQLGILPQFGNQIDGLTGSPTVPQVNQTNQTSLPAAVGGM
ncbi:MAG: hypothetical protein JWN41_1005, partial [Thermoleophilia bacterium]|nr:hypothetical protein [Thermoleophilia bacterium]